MLHIRDISKAITQGGSEQEALEMAEDALVSAMDFYVEDRLVVPFPSMPQPGDIVVRLPARVVAKVLLLNAQLAQGVSNSELARRLGLPKQAMQRVTDLHHATEIDTVERTLRVLGKELR